MSLPPTPPASSVLLQQCGFRPVPESEHQWNPPDGGNAVHWTACCKDVVACWLNKRAAMLARPEWKTQSFWLGFASVAGSLGVAVTGLTGAVPSDALPDGMQKWLTLIGLSGAGISAAAYKFGQHMATKFAADENKRLEPK